MIPYDYDQTDWGSTLVYNDYTLAGSWNPDMHVLHWGGETEVPNFRFLNDAVEWEMARLRFWQRYHRSRRWQDIGYNTAVGQSGMIYRLRGQNHSGATSGYIDGVKANSRAHATVWIGGKQTQGGPSDAAYAGFAKVINALPYDRVLGHMEVSPRQCPGPDIMRYIGYEEWNISPPIVVDDDEMFCKRGDD